MKKKILSVLLAVLMLTSILPMSAISAYAAQYTTPQLNNNDDSVTYNKGDEFTSLSIYPFHVYVDNTRVLSAATKGSYTVPYCLKRSGKSSARLDFVRNCSYSGATCQKVGTCTKCGVSGGSKASHSYTATGNLYSAATCTSPAYYYKKCAWCTATNGTKTSGSALAHSYTTQGSKVSDATIDSPAIYNKKCATCTAQSGTMQVGDKLPSAVINYVDPSTGETVEKEATNDTVGTIVDELLSKPMQNNKKGIFLGWFADGEALQKGTSRFDALTDITAGYTPVKQIEKDFNDDKMIDSYKSFGLAGVQIREDNTQESYEYGYDELEGQVYGGLRYVASFSEQLKSIVENNANVEYGFVMASTANARLFADHYGVDYDKYEIKYNTGVNGGTADTDYRYVTNVVCSNNIDHRNFDGYRLFTAVIDYKDAEGLKDTEFVARAYVKYVDANGNTQIYYDDYDGTTTFGGCSISYNHALAMSR